ncbi:hypothetical protein GCM10020254_68120 [Streptomyces goshikiensis]
MHAVQRMAASWQLQRRPVVMEVANSDLPHCIESFALQDIPFVFKVDGTLPVSFGGAGRHKPGPHTAPARELIDSLRSQRRVVEWTRHGRAEGSVTPADLRRHPRHPLRGPAGPRPADPAAPGGRLDRGRDAAVRVLDHQHR